MATSRRKPSEIQINLKNKRDRIEKSYGKNKVGKIIRIEKEWERRSFNSALQGSSALEDLLFFDPIRGEGFSEIVKLMESTAKRWASKCHYLRLGYHDFLSRFYYTALKEIYRYSWAKAFYLYETLEKAFNNRAKDLIRWAKRDKRKSLHEALPLLDFYPDPVNVSQLIIDREYEEQLLSGLTDPERLVLIAVLDGDSQRKIARCLMKDRKTISRTLKRIRGKLAPVMTA